MKKIILLILIGLSCVSLSSCSKQKSGIENYQYMYDVVDDWNKQAIPSAKRKNLFGYGEYLYNSYLVLFPRNTPSTLTDFFFEWIPLIDVDGYAIYFTCKLSESDYDNFIHGLENFSIDTENEKHTLLKDESNFSYPAFIIQWSKPEEKWEVLEYLLLDNENNTIIFVYTMGELDTINKNVSYDILPKAMDFLTGTDFENYSIYEDFENGTYNIDFLEYLH